jgi:hypothetical protein
VIGVGSRPEPQEALESMENGNKKGTKLGLGFRSHRGNDGSGERIFEQVER